MTSLKTCPVCGSKKITRVVEPLCLPTRRGVVRVPGVPLDRCKNCGEEFLDSMASRKIDSAIFGSIRAPRRRKTA